MRQSNGAVTLHVRPNPAVKVLESGRGHVVRISDNGAVDRDAMYPVLLFAVCALAMVERSVRVAISVPL